MAEQPTMAEVLALHMISDRKSQYSGAVWCSCGFRTEFTGHVYDEYRTHVAQELSTAGFGNQHNAWAEGYGLGGVDTALSMANGEHHETPNPYT